MLCFVRELCVDSNNILYIYIYHTSSEYCGLRQILNIIAKQLETMFFVQESFDGIVKNIVKSCESFRLAHILMVKAG